MSDHRLVRALRRPTALAARGIGLASGTVKGGAGLLGSLASQALGRETDQPAGAAPVLPTGPRADGPPIDVVGEALRAEAEASTYAGHQEGEGRATEPRGATRADEHGAEPIGRAEHDEWADELVDDEPALQADEPLLDPALAKQVRREQETLHRAADVHKE